MLVIQLHMHPAEIGRVRTHVAGDLVLGVGGGHGPSRIEIDVGDFGHNRGGGLFGLADHHAIAVDDLVVLYRFHIGPRNIDGDESRAELEADRGCSQQRRLELLAAFFCGDVERGQGSRADGSCLWKAVADLKVLQASNERIVEFSRRFGGSKIAADDQALAKQGNMRTLGAWRKLRFLRDRRPSAMVDDGSVFLDCLLKAAGSALVEVRLLGQRKVLGRFGSRLRGGCLRDRIGQFLLGGRRLTLRRPRADQNSCCKQ